jgi:probable rRNA maturation factor
LTGDRPGVFVQFAARDPGTPDAPFLERCVRQAFDDVPGEVVIRVVDEAESAALNQRYRAKPGATNVLAFPPGEVPVDADEPVPLGDIVICAAVVTREAVAQRKTVAAHWAHLVIHACLHLQAYDHMTDDEAERMEDRERELLAGLGVADPYADEG